MNRVAFQIYGNKKTGIFQSTWDTNLTEVSTTELATTATGTNWTGTSYTLGYTHIPGSTVALTSTIVSQIGFNFRLVATITNRTAGSVNINWGGTSNTGIFATTTLELLTTSTTAQLLITPTSDFDGKIVLSLRCTSAPSNQLKLPLVSTGTYNFWVDWGDGTYDNITSWNQAQRIHTYASPGTYTTRITGIITGWESMQGNNYFGDRKKLTSVTSWGKLKPSTRGFDGCSNMILTTVSDLLDLSHLTNMQFMFANCTALTVIGRSSEWKTSTITDLNNCFYNSINFNSPLNGWDTSNVTNMGGMFLGCTNFNQNLGSWNVSNCINFSGMFSNCTNFNNGGSPDINNWVFKTSGNINVGSMFAGCTNFNQPLNNWNTTRFTNTSGMFSGATSFNQNIGSWDMSNSTSLASMFNSASAFNNGGSPDINNWVMNTNPAVNLSFYQMFIEANAFNQPLYNWNTVRVNNMNGMFYSNGGCIFNNGNAAGVASVLPWNTSNVTSMGSMFRTTWFNCDISSWDVRKVTEFGQMFYGCSNFNNGGNPNINNWVLKSTGTISMGSMFRAAGAFNQPLNLWNMSRVTVTGYMFLGANSFNQNVDGWDLSTATNIAGMFECASFNNGYPSGIGNTISMTLNTTTPFFAWQMFRCAAFNCDINGLDFTRCTDMSNMFAGAIKYNNGLTPGTAGVLTINTSNVTLMSGMFNGCTSFNQDIGLFNVSKVTSFNAMLFNTRAYNNGADANPINNWTLNTTVGANIDMTNMFGGNSGAKVFNRALNNWNTSEVTSMNGMFLNTGGTHSFNQPIDNWVMSKVTNTSGMFSGNGAFNQSLSNWERAGSTLANVTNMSEMFSSATAFQQNIGNWDVRNVTNFTSFMLGKTPTTFASTYLDNIYNGWSTLPSVKPNIVTSFGTAKYTAVAQAGKAILTGSPNNWSITDGLLVVSTTTNSGGLIRITTTVAHGLTTGNSVFVYGVGGTTNANGTWTVTVISTTVIQLNSSVYDAAWTSGGNVILG